MPITPGVGMMVFRVGFEGVREMTRHWGQIWGPGDGIQGLGDSLKRVWEQGPRDRFEGIWLCGS